MNMKKLLSLVLAMLLALILERLSLCLEKGMGGHLHSLSSTPSTPSSASSVSGGTSAGSRHKDERGKSRSSSIAVAEMDPYAYGGGPGGATAGHGAVGGYQIDSRHERDQVMRVLLLTKGREIVAACARLKRRYMVDSMLDATERRAGRIIHKLRSWES